MSGLGTEELNPKRPLAMVEVEVFAGTLVASKDAFGSNEFGNENVCAVTLADLAKNLVRHTRHWGEVEREGIIGEPKETGLHQSIIPQNGPQRRWMGKLKMTKQGWSELDWR